MASTETIAKPQLYGRTKKSLKTVTVQLYGGRKNIAKERTDNAAVAAMQTNRDEAVLQLYDGTKNVARE
jgi:hypothetical protein